MNEELVNLLSNIADVECSRFDSDVLCYYSKFDGSCLGHVGMEKSLIFLLEYGITEQIQDSRNCCGAANIGFSPASKKWYGWSHRGIAGFTIGSECNIGNVHYRPSNKEEFMKSCFDFYENGEYSIGDDVAIFSEREVDGKIVSGVTVAYTYDDNVPNEELRNTICKVFFPFPEKFGRGEWVAKTLDDAKQMAIDYATEIS